MLRQFVVALLLVGSALVQAETPKPGAAAPEFSLSDQNGKQRKPADFRGRWLVLYFYPKNDTPG
jgi:thioredoxin-dependent peroxiredoxin